MKALKYSDLPVAILCGGLGTRLGTLTANTPKSLVRVAGRPFIDHQLDILHRHGFSSIFLLVGHLADKFREIGGVTLLNDGPLPLGTGGAVKKAIPSLGDEFYVLYGDSCLPHGYEAVFKTHRTRGKAATMSVWNDVDYGINILTTGAFDEHKGRFDIHEVYAKLRKNNQLATHKMAQRFHEIGSPEGLAEVRKLLE